jgi:hypothetical protein
MPFAGTFRCQQLGSTHCGSWCATEATEFDDLCFFFCNLFVDRVQTLATDQALSPPVTLTSAISLRIAFKLRTGDN